MSNAMLLKVNCKKQIAQNKFHEVNCTKQAKSKWHKTNLIKQIAQTILLEINLTKEIALNNCTKKNLNNLDVIIKIQKQITQSKMYVVFAQKVDIVL